MKFSMFISTHLLLLCTVMADGEKHLRVTKDNSSDEMEIKVAAVDKDPSSCHGFEACEPLFENGKVLADSCNNSGKNACGWLGTDTGFGFIGESSCNDGGAYVCAANGETDGKGHIGDGSCNMGGMDTCARNGYHGDGRIGDNSCSPGNNSTKYSCLRNGEEGYGRIGNNACNAPDACNLNKGTIADGCCNFEGACNENTGNITVGSAECGTPYVPPTLPPTSPGAPTCNVQRIQLKRFCINTRDEDCGRVTHEYKFKINNRRYYPRLPVRFRNFQAGCQSNFNAPQRVVRGGLFYLKTVERDRCSNNDRAMVWVNIGNSCEQRTITFTTSNGNTGKFLVTGVRQEDEHLYDEDLDDDFNEEEFEEEE